MPCLLELVSLGLASINCLQVGIDQKQLAPWSSYDGVVDWSSSLHNYSDTAHVLRQLDLVISVDTAVAHLSAALNNLHGSCCHGSDFHWLLSRRLTLVSQVCLFHLRQTDWFGDQVSHLLLMIFLCSIYPVLHLLKAI